MYQEKIKNAVNVYRVSAVKQFLQGNSFDDQKMSCYALNKRENHNLIKEFCVIESATKDNRELFQEVIDFCTDPKNKIDVLVIKCIDRFTRGGAASYEKLKSELSKHEVDLIDTYGFIQPQQNSMEHYGVEYGWSRHSPSQGAEIMAANQAKQEVRDILTRVIGAEIRYTDLGYGIRQAPFGYMNTKVETEHGKRTIRVPHPTESVWIIKMFNMRVDGFDDKKIVSEVNRLGFKTRVQNVRDKRTKQAIGKKGGIPLTVKQMQEFVKRPIYAGYIYETWGKNTARPRVITKKAQFNGLVSVDTFNKANNGKVVIVEDEIAPQILFDQKPKRRTRNNPMFPFKEIRCPDCGKGVVASPSTNGSGEPNYRYHCGGKTRGHKYWSKAKDKFEEPIYEFIKEVKFSDDFVKLFKEVVLDVWNNKRKDALQQAQVSGRKVIELEAKKENLIDTMSTLPSDELKQDFLDRISKLRTELELLKRQRNQNEQKELDIEELVNYAGHLMERTDELLIDTNNSEQQRMLFRLLFKKMPSYDELVSRTLNLSPAFKLKEQSALTKSELVNHSYDSLNSMIQEFIEIIKSLPEIFSPQPALALVEA